MNGLIYTLKLSEPVLANSLAGDANSATSLPYVPGGLVRGALIGLYLRENPLQQEADVYPDFRRLFLSGQTRYLHAYPFEEGDRTLPIPLAWKVRKDEASGIEGQAVEAFNLAVALPEEDDLKGVKAENWWLRGEIAYTREIPIQVNIHTQRDAVFGRAKEDRGAVFRYEALAAGLRVRGVILTGSQDDAETLKSLFARRELFLGKARTAGYGRVQVESVADLPEAWREGWDWQEEEDYELFEDEEDYFDEVELAGEAVSQFTLTFLSAGLVRDHCGQFTLDPLLALKARLKTELSPIQEENQPPHIFRSPEVVGGFNRKWGLPLLQVAAIAPGSVFVLKAYPPVSLDDLHALEETGVGERRAEGFGRVTVDIEQPEAVPWYKQGPEKAFPPGETEIELSGAAQGMADLILRRMLRRELDERLMEVVRKHHVGEKYHIPNSHLSRWRVLLRSALSGEKPEAGLGRLTKFAAEERKRHSSAWQKMRRARIAYGNRRLTDWIDDVLTGENSPWTYLGYGENEQPEQKFGEAVRVIPNAALVMEYKIRLIDRVLAAYAKRQGGAND